MTKQPTWSLMPDLCKAMYNNKWYKKSSSVIVWKNVLTCTFCKENFKENLYSLDSQWYQNSNAFLCIPDCIFDKTWTSRQNQKNWWMLQKQHEQNNLHIIWTWNRFWRMIMQKITVYLKVTLTFDGWPCPKESITMKTSVKFDQILNG